MTDRTGERTGPASAPLAADGARPDILRTLRTGMEQLSAGQRRIAAMILEDPERAVHENVDELARRAGVSAPSIVRFARAVGCEGLTDLKLKLAGSLALGQPYLHHGVQRGDGAADVIRNVVGSATAVLAEWQRTIDPDAVERAARAIDQAGRIDCYGTGATSNFLAQDLQARLFRLGLNAGALSDAHYQLASACTLGPGDVVVAVSFVGRMPTLLEAAQVGKERGATVIALTRSHTPLAEMADIVLGNDVPRDPIMRVGTDAYLVQLLLIEMLMVIVGLKRGAAAMDRLRDIQHTLQTHGIDSDDPSVLHWCWRSILRPPQG
ncbi:transcriptional regulator, RpiR family [Rhizobiales bacterium GAS188]|nr:transcriptional regulator, RpiR family [Rhizobiales bacterium GAS188]